MKSKIITPKELYNTVQIGQLFYLYQDDEGTINNPCLHFVLFIERCETLIKVVSLVNENCQIMNDLWSKNEAIFLNENRLIKLIFT